VNKTTIAFIEVGMLAGIVLAAITLPRSTPLLTFLAISGVFFVAGNILLVMKIKQVKVAKDQRSVTFGPHFYRALALLIAYWLVRLLFSK